VSKSNEFDPRAGSHLWVAYKRELWPKVGQTWYCTQFGEAAFQIQNYILRWSDLSESFFLLLGRQDVLPYQTVFQVSEEALIEFSACVRRESLKNWQINCFHQNEANPFPKDNRTGASGFPFECETCRNKPGSPILCPDCLIARTITTKVNDATDST